MTAKEALLREALKLQEILNTWGNVLANGKPAAVRLQEICHELKENYGITEDNIDDEIDLLINGKNKYYEIKGML